MATVLSNKAVEAAKPAAARREIPDALVPGLRLVVQPTGAKSWAVRYRLGGSPKKLVLGPVAPVIDDYEPPAVLGLPLTLKGARAVAREQLQLVAAGRDPGQEKQSARRVANDPDTRERDLVRVIAAQFLDKYVRPRAKPSYAKGVAYIFDKDVLPRWGERRIQDIRRRDVLELLDAVVERGAAVQANRVLAAIRKLFAWAVARDMLEASPAAGVKAPTPEASRDRVLDDAELRLVWLAAEKVGYPFGPFARLLILTGARRDEVAGMRRSEIDAGVWTVPAARVKNRRAHVLALPALALKVLDDVPKVKVGKDQTEVPAHKGLRDLYFTTTGASPVSGYTKGKERLDAAMLDIARREAKERGDDPEAVSIRAWTFHDLRRSAASGLARLGVPLHVVERLLNHVSGSFGGIVGTYQRHGFEAEVREALATWAAHIGALGAEEAK